MSNRSLIERIDQAYPWPPRAAYCIVANLIQFEHTKFPRGDATLKTAANPGQSLKALRQRHGWTLSDVADRTGLAVSTLSKIENGKISLSYDKLARISTGLGVDIGALFAPQETERRPAELIAGRRSINRAGEGRAIETNVYHHLYVASDLLSKNFVPIVVEVRARSVDDFSEMIRHPGEEYTYVLEGALELHTDIYAPLRLETGDSIYFDSGMGHIYVAVSEGPCRVLSICSGDESLLHKTSEAISTNAPDATGGKPPVIHRAG